MPWLARGQLVGIGPLLCRSQRSKPCRQATGKHSSPLSPHCSFLIVCKALSSAFSLSPPYSSHSFLYRLSTSASCSVLCFDLIFLPTFVLESQTRVWLFEIPSSRHSGHSGTCGHTQQQDSPHIYVFVYIYMYEYIHIYAYTRKEIIYQVYTKYIQNTLCI